MAPAPAAPPALPPSVEEAYRRKCIQLKQRTSEVEEANDAARLRLARLKRQVEKMRLERAFLLEQLAKRTSTNVEDSDGSPSPPPTPKEKPLRIKRGHRKPSAFPNLDALSSHTTATPGSTGIGQNRLVDSPSSDAQSGAQQGDGSSSKTNGTHKGAPPKKPASAFDLYCEETRPSVVQEQAKDAEGGDRNNDDAIDEELARRWDSLPDDRRNAYSDRAGRLLAEYEKEKAAYDAKGKGKDKTTAAAADSGAKADKDKSDESTEPERPAAREGADARAAQEDVDMANSDTDQETPGEKAAA